MAQESRDRNKILKKSQKDSPPSNEDAPPPEALPPSPGGDSKDNRDSPPKSPPPPKDSPPPPPKDPPPHPPKYSPPPPPKYSPPPPPKDSPPPPPNDPPSPPPNDPPSPPPKDPPSPPPKDSPSPPPKASPSPPPSPSSPPPPLSHDNDSTAPPPPKQPPPPPPPPSSKNSPPPAQPTPPPPPDNSSASDNGTSDRSPPPPPQRTSLPPSFFAAVNSSPPPPKTFSSPPPTVFSPPPNSKSNRPPPPHSPEISHGSRGKSNRSTSNPSNSSSGKGGDNMVKYVAATLAGASVIALVVIIVLLVCMWRRRKRVEVYAAPLFMPVNNLPMAKGADGHYYVQQHGAGSASQDGIYRSNGSQNQLHTTDTGPKPAQIVFSYENIVEITNGFSRQNILGEGGFGCVYKAWLPDGRVAAVKKLKAGSGQGEREFKAEVEIINRVHHKHLVSLVGYCIEKKQRILIYEFVPNKTLNHHLHGSEMTVLDWAERQKIAIGAAKGLAYLHEDCSPRIIHRDIKSANILLDDAFEAKVADFGLAKLSDDANTHVSTRVVGTFGYMAPEYATSGKLTDRSDVFSFGVVLLELVTGRKPVDQSQPLGEESLVEWARPLLIHAVETRDFGALVDPRLEGRFVESEMFRMIEAAAACIRHSAPKRPRMVQLVRALDSGGELFDLSNGVKYGQSTIYDSGQYNEDIMKFRRMNNESSVNSDIYSGDYSFSREMSGQQQTWVPGNSRGESETRSLHGHSVSTEHKNTRERR
ncbi:hypothetical protein L6164_027249 [Bauhinia variegata]|uniref:Uncharacterized protein n=1 Tax=Bauhinia variegata TaxID=167791 RepID=A0ACB9LU25_BAUVA|nr:hypothetical protein L6164_027249 [Bauhinia variegata]